MLTTEFPFCLGTTELAAQLTARNLDLSLEWRRRDTNEEADALTNKCFNASDPALRLDAARALTSFLCLRELEVATREWRRERYARAQHDTSGHDTHPGGDANREAPRVGGRGGFGGSPTP